MALIDTKTKMFLQRNKEGAILGGIAGALMAFYVRGTGADFIGAAAGSNGLLDKIVQAAPADLAFYKLLITYVVLGIFVGMLLDYLFEPGK